MTARLLDCTLLLGVPAVARSAGGYIFPKVGRTLQVPCDFVVYGFSGSNDNNFYAIIMLYDTAYSCYSENVKEQGKKCRKV